MRRFSLLETNHRFLRSALRTPAVVTSLRHLFRRASCDSPDLKLTDKTNTSNLHRLPSPSQPLPGRRNTRTAFPSRDHRAQQPSPRFSQASDEAQYDSIQITSHSLPVRNGLQEPVSPTSVTNTYIGALRDVVSYPSGAATSTAAPLPLGRHGQGHMDFTSLVRPAQTTGPDGPDDR